MIAISKGKETETNGEAKIDDQVVLGRCILGSFDKAKAENHTLSDSSVWKKAFGINIYEMLDRCFLFEFPNRYMAEQVLQGEWLWMRSKLKLEWWHPTAGCAYHLQTQTHMD